ncbi:Putative VAMP-like protein [Glycine soja]|nr:Putative VAMP-like protein [Glycine soja]
MPLKKEAMISNPELIHYACIARSETILGQHQSEKEPNMEALAAQCVAQAPPNHTLFSHTVHNRTYTFLIDTPFVFFAISHHSLLKSQTLPFLHRIRSSFRQTLPPSSNNNHHFAPLSFQSQFTSIFQNALHHHHHHHHHQLQASPPPPPPPPLNPPPQGLKKKKRPNDAPGTLDVSDDVVSLKPHHQPLNYNHSNKAKHVWKKHVWVLLILDLFVCAVLFVIWLWVCSGFKCMAY